MREYQRCGYRFLGKTVEQILADENGWTREGQPPAATYKISYSPDGQQYLKRNDGLCVWLRVNDERGKVGHLIFGVPG